jgi:hypothetical protein
MASLNEFRELYIVVREVGKMTNGLYVERHLGEVLV